MRFTKPLLVVAPLLALFLAPARDAAASGGYIPSSQTMESTEVSGHRMILSLLGTETTLWDQISYVGSPESFAWVLPIKGMAEVGISSDALFNTLEGPTEVTINPPARSCPPPPPSCAAGGEVRSFVPRPPLPWGGVVIARDVVGPYDMAQFSSQDPSALQAWFTSNGFVISAEVSPIISAYAAEGFNFVAIKLLPEKGIQSMKPIRVTTSGVNPVLPLRMVAAGAGKAVPITLFVVHTLFIYGQGSYVPSSSPWFTVPKDKLIWDWDKQESNYQSLRQEGFARTSNKGWLVEAAGPVFPEQVKTPLCTYLATFGPELSGYTGNATNALAEVTCSTDIRMLFGEQLSQQRWMTRLHAELPKEALAADLTLELNSETESVPSILDVKESIGEAPACPSDATCSDTDADSSGCDCSAGGAAGASAAPFGALLSLGWILVRRRKKAGRGASPSASPLS